MFLPRSVFKHILIGMAKNGQVFKLVFECGVGGQIVPLQRSFEEFHKSIAQDAIDAQREELIENIEKQLKQRRSVRTQFAVRWEVV